MASITLTYAGPADGNSAASLTHTGSVPDAQMPSFFAAYREIYGPKTPAVVDKSGNVTTPAVAYTDAEVFELYAQGAASGTATNVRRYLEEQAKAAAVAQVAAVAVTQTQ